MLTYGWMTLRVMMHVYCESSEGLWIWDGFYFAALICGVDLMDASNWGMTAIERD
jgi:hypothetical protein